VSGQKCECEEGIAEWVMSYADMITILMAFFVVMYSMAGTPDEAKEEAVFRSLREQFGPMIRGWQAMGHGPYVRTDSQMAQWTSMGAARRQAANRGGAENRGPRGEHPRVHSLRPGEQESIGGMVYFPEGSSTLTPKQKQQLQTIAEELGGKPQKIEIRGHTSRRPPPVDAPFRDNWDLAYSRCRSVLDDLVSLGLDPRRFRLSVAAENEPAPGGRDVLERGFNSRVEVFLLSEVAEKLHDGAPDSPVPSEPAASNEKAPSNTEPAGRSIEAK
jgi:chemotaxis protein MotB